MNWIGWLVWCPHQNSYRHTKTSSLHSNDKKAAECKQNDVHSAVVLTDQMILYSTPATFDSSKMPVNGS